MRIFTLLALILVFPRCSTSPQLYTDASLRRQQCQEGQNGILFFLIKEKIQENKHKFKNDIQDNICPSILAELDVIFPPEQSFFQSCSTVSADDLLDRFLIEKNEADQIMPIVKRKWAAEMDLMKMPDVSEKLRHEWNQFSPFERSTLEACQKTITLIRKAYSMHP